MIDFLAVNQQNFDQEVLQSSVPVIVEFGAPWCMPCKHMEPTLLKFAQEHEDRVRLVKVNVDESADLAARYQVLSVPTVLLFKGGQPIERLTGNLPPHRVAEKFTPHIH